jgi:hypothetical protein
MQLDEVLRWLARRWAPPAGPSWQQLVTEFHRAAGRAVPAAPVGALVSSQATFYEDLLDEEMKELRVAVAGTDIVAVADALADVVYVACDITVAYGLGTSDALAHYPIATVLTGEVLVEYLSGVMSDLHIAFHLHDVAFISRCLASVVAACDWAGFCYGFDLDPVVREVHKSNMTKLGPDGRFVARGDGKILKGPGYRPPDIAGALRSAPSSGAAA